MDFVFVSHGAVYRKHVQITRHYRIFVAQQVTPDKAHPQTAHMSWVGYLYHMRHKAS